MREYIQMKLSSSSLFMCMSFFLLLSSCGTEDRIVISDLSIQLGQSLGESVHQHRLDLSDAITSGIHFPDAAQGEDSLIRFSFNVSNLKPGERIYYKMFYKNVSYSNETDRDFYGGWGSLNEQFHMTEAESTGSVLIEDGFRIQGDPRNEAKFLGGLRSNSYPSDQEILVQENEIKNSKDWSEAVQLKANQNKRSFDEQVTMDAMWCIRKRKDEGNAHNRWKRNPRMGTYRFMLVTMSEKAYEGLSDAEKDISVSGPDGKYLDPFLIFPDKRGVTTITSGQGLNLSLSLDPSKGIYVDRLKSGSALWDTTHYASKCNTGDQLFNESQWSQFFHGINSDYYLKNVPLTVDVLSGYSQEQYAFNQREFPVDKRDSTLFNISQEPCRTVYLEGDSCIVLANPPGIKEPVGIKSRIGMTYGTYTLKVSFPRMLNDDFVWNGITNAFWLIYEDDAPWNERSPSEKGYMLKSQKEDGPEVRHPTSHYSEIDIEIVKDAVHWPETSYAGGKHPPFDDPSSNKDIIVSYTNWDMGYREVDKYVVGVTPMETPHGDFIFHRWNPLNNAITCKQAFSHDEIFGRPFYYFQIEWHPEHITWRMGPSKENMIVFGHMDGSFTGIPDNQMLAVVTQEFHASEWWPTAPFTQNDIPFPAEPLIGRVIELTVE